MKQFQVSLLEQISQDDWENTPAAVKQRFEALLAAAILPESDRRLVQFLDATPIGIAVHDAAGNIIYINNIGRMLLGIKQLMPLKAELLSSAFQVYQEGTSQLYPPEALPSARALQGETVYADDLEVHRSDRMVLEVWATPIFDEQGDVSYALAAFQDVSDRKRRDAEQQILRNTILSNTHDVDEPYRQILHNQTDLILRSRPDMTVIFANHTLCQTFGYTAEQFMGCTWDQLVPSDDLQELQQKVVQLSPEQPTFQSVNRNYQGSDRTLYIQWMNRGIFDEQGTLVEIQSVGRDVTALQEQIHREKALNRVVKAIRNSLDLNTIFATATTEVAQLFAPIDCFVIQYLADQSVWRTIAEYRDDPNALATIGFEIPDKGNPFAEQLRQFQIVRLDNTHHLQDAINQEVAQTYPGAWLLIPVVVDGAVWGSFSMIRANEPSPWSAEQVELAQTVVEQLEIAIYQANLYQQVQRELVERQRVEGALRDSEARFQNMASNVPGAIFRYLLRTDGTTSVLYMSPGCIDLWEVENSAVVEDAGVLWAMVHPDDLPEMQASVMKSAQTLQPWSYAWRITTPSGQEKWLEAAGRPTRQPNGDVIWDTLALDVTDRKQTEQRFEILAANLPGVIYQYVLRPDGSSALVYVSPGCRDLWELEPEELIADAEATWQMVHPEDLPTMRDLVLESAQTLQPWNYEWRITPKSGQEKWLQASARPQQHPNGDIVWDGLILDVSDRKQAEMALRVSDARFQTMADNIPGVLFGYRLCPDGSDEYTYISSGFYDLYGFPPESALRDADVIWGMTHPDDVPKLIQTTLDSYETLKTWKCQYRVITPTGEIKWIQGISRPTRQPNGDVIWDGLIIDISDRKRAEKALKTSEQRFRNLFELTPKIAVQGYDRDRKVIYWNEASTLLYGYEKQDAIGQRLEDLIIPSEMRDQVIQDVQRWMDGGPSIPASELSLRRKDGSRVSVYSSHIMLMNPESELEIYCVDIDLSDRKQAEAALRDSEARYRLVAENMNDLVCLHDVDGRYLYVSPSCEFLLGYDCAALVGREPSELIHPDDRDRAYGETRLAALGQRSTPITYRMRKQSGDYLWFETLIKPILDINDNIIQLQTTSRDVTERVQVQNQLEYEALHDALTGLPNRTLLINRLDLAIHRTQRHPTYQFAIIFLDLDRFKVINDSLGHLAGDQMLVAIAHILQTITRASDLAVRFGGDEFVLLLEDIDGIYDAVNVVERIFVQFGTPLLINNREVYTTSSVGIVLGDRHYTRASDVLRDADIAMYRAKNSGKARYEIFNMAMHTQAVKRLHIEQDLRRAITHHEFILHYQPIIELDTGKLSGFEALVRWQHPTEGLKLPGEFVAIAEETGLIIPIDAWALEEACRQLSVWQAELPHAQALKMSVNLSVQDMRRPHLLTDIDRILGQYQLTGNPLTLEITESMLIDQVESTIELLQQLRSRGIHISIDDFGTGYSSLSYLHRLPVDYLKVDRSFVHQILQDDRNHRIVETIMTLSNQLGMSAVAEGIETQCQLEHLQQLGYQFGQGYFFAKPLPAKDAERLILHR
jgi:diguanylate cyclase (GGDEF)-like protein/PAS domain S-box-containing protein